VTTLAHPGLAPARRLLSNGATLIAQHTTTHAAVTLVASVPAGSGFDPDALLGLAHFTARAIDRGTETRTPDALAEAFDARGVSLSTSASRHLLTLSCTCLTEDIEEVLALVADVLRRPIFPPDQVERRRTAIVTSIRQDEDNPGAVATEELMTALYSAAHPYGRRSKGTVASIERIARDDLAAFHRAHVGPGGLRLVMVGDVESARALDLAAAAFGDWDAPGGMPLVPPPVVAATTRQAHAVTIPGKAQSDIAYGFTTITRADPRYYALSVMNNILGQYGLGGRLGDSIRERQGMAYYVFSSFDANVAAGPLVVRAGVNPGNVARAVASIDDEIRRMAADGVSQQEVTDTQRYLVGSMPRVLETNSGIASFLHTADFFGLGLDFDRRLPALVEGVTRDEVNDVARTFLVPDRAAVVVAGPLA
jgi:zinc protease